MKVGFLDLSSQVSELEKKITLALASNWLDRETRYGFRNKFNAKVHLKNPSQLESLLNSINEEIKVRKKMYSVDRGSEAANA